MVMVLLISGHGLLISDYCLFKVLHDTKVDGSEVRVFSRLCFQGPKLLDGLQGPLFDWDDAKTRAGSGFHRTCHCVAVRCTFLESRWLLDVCT